LYRPGTGSIDVDAVITAAFGIEVTGRQHLKRKGKGKGDERSKISGVGVSQL
jgi:hypothetical protein